MSDLHLKQENLKQAEKALNERTNSSSSISVNAELRDYNRNVKPLANELTQKEKLMKELESLRAQ